MIQSGVNNTVNLSVSVEGGDPALVQMAVEDALGRVLYDQRRASRWS